MKCTICKGEKVNHERFCISCHGTGEFPEVDTGAIIDALFTKKGFRASCPKKHDRYKTTLGARVYYVWRMARFHGGADVTMPMTAQMVTRGDPAIDTLDKVADEIAKRVFGTDRAAMHRWGNLLGFAPAAPQGLPDSAYAGGPVADEHKPTFEQLELK